MNAPRRLLASLTAATAVLLGLGLLGPASALAAFGDQLAAFSVPVYEGRGIAVVGSTALLSYEGSAALDEVNLASHESVGQVATTGAPADGFGALSVDPSGRLWAAEYSETQGNIDLIDGEGRVQTVFDAADPALDEADKGIDGLAIAPDGTIWVSGEGLQPGPTRVDHFKIDGETVEEIGHFSVPFGNSGIAADSEGHLWLAEIEASGGGWGTTIHEYTEAGSEVRSFPLGTAGGEEIHPEGIALDHCTFPGKLALWAFGANGTTSPLVAYEIGTTTDTSGCPGRAPSLSAQGPSGNGAVAGGPTTLDAADPADPNGTAFTYVWDFGDGHRFTGAGRVQHRYLCAGLYRVKVTEIDSAGARHVSSASLAVGFPRSATRFYRGASFSPHVQVHGHRAKFWLSWRELGLLALTGRSVSWVDWTLERRHGYGFGMHTKVVATIKRGRDHALAARVHFSDRHAVTMRTCFHA